MINDMKCRYCSSVNNLMRCFKYISKVTGSTKWYYTCRSCNTKRCRQYRTSENGKQAVLNAVKNYENKHPERRNAWRKAQIMELKPCIICGANKTHRHHPDPLKPLEVVMFCPLHHKEAHVI